MPCFFSRGDVPFDSFIANIRTKRYYKVITRFYVNDKKIIGGEEESFYGKSIFIHFFFGCWFMILGCARCTIIGGVGIIEEVVMGEIIGVCCDLFPSLGFLKL